MSEWNAAQCLMKAQEASKDKIEKEKNIIKDIINGYAITGLTKCNIEISKDVKREEITQWLEILGFKVENIYTISGVPSSRIVIDWSGTVEEETPEGDA